MIHRHYHLMISRHYPDKTEHLLHPSYIKIGNNASEKGEQSPQRQRVWKMAVAARTACGPSIWPLSTSYLIYGPSLDVVHIKGARKLPAAGPIKNSRTCRPSSIIFSHLDVFDTFLWWMPNTFFSREGSKTVTVKWVKRSGLLSTVFDVCKSRGLKKVCNGVDSFLAG